MRAAFAALFLPVAGIRKTVGINPSLIIALRISGKDTILKTLKAGTKYPGRRCLTVWCVSRDLKKMSEQVLNTISFAGRAAASNQFKSLYTEGMTLVEETASYLDGAGRTASKVLPRMASVLYAAESMRLTTRLMQMASWLLLQRAVNNGEMTRDQVLSEKTRCGSTASTLTATRRAGTICRNPSATSSSGRCASRTALPCSTAKSIARPKQPRCRTTKTAYKRSSTCYARLSRSTEKRRLYPDNLKSRLTGLLFCFGRKVMCTATKTRQQKSPVKPGFFKRSVRKWIRGRGRRNAC
ncbi:conserved hypothetical protein [Agrobacterium sp. NCPPB 925]|nr:conserved hypothetical protein [Agrobacterium sp. NCPPB 925]